MLLAKRRATTGVIVARIYANRVPAPSDQLQQRPLRTRSHSPPALRFESDERTQADGIRQAIPVAAPPSLLRVVGERAQVERGYPPFDHLSKGGGRGSLGRAGLLPELAEHRTRRACRHGVADDHVVPVREEDGKPLAWPVPFRIGFRRSPLLRRSFGCDVRRFAKSQVQLRRFGERQELEVSGPEISRSSAALTRFNDPVVP
jgi:hypothetical protein